MNIAIHRLEKTDHATIAGINSLLPQLSHDLPPITPKRLSTVIQDPANAVYIAIDETNDNIVGMATVITIRQITGTKCRVEDVVVADGYRGHGIGKRLMQAAITGAPEDTQSIDLTSNPRRKAAHHLYTELGFEMRDTAVFRLDVSERPI